jgi:hypothetical protein
MSRKSSRPDESNLELLLDTVCNTFGVVLFISMLVVIRVNASQAEVESQPPEAESALELIERQQELEKARARMRQLREALAQQQSVADRFSSTESRRLASSVQSSTESLIVQLEEKERTLSRIASEQQDVNKIASQLENQKETLEQLRQQASAIQSQLDREVKSRSRTSRVPELRQSKRQPVPLFLKKGLLCRYYKPGRFLSRNAQEVAKTVDPASLVVFVDPIPGAGLAISPDPPNANAIKTALTGFSPDDHVLQVFFWPDSFSHCQVLRDAMVDMGFRHSLIPMPDNERVSVGKSSGPVFEQ